MLATVQQESNPFAPKPTKARTLPSILERDDQGLVVWITGDPARVVIDLLGLSASQERDVRRVIEERDRLLVDAAIVNADKIVRALQAKRADDMVQYDEFARSFASSLGLLTRRGAIHVDVQIREELGRVKNQDLSAIVREYNLARTADERARMEAEAAAQGVELAEFFLRDSTILQRLMHRDIVADASRLLHDRLGGEAALAEAHPELAGVVGSIGFWPAMSRLSESQLAEFVSARTGVEVRFPSPEGDAALAPVGGGMVQPDDVQSRPEGEG